jgi:hypothetical protein
MTTKAQQRVAIAKDVIAQIKANQLIVNSGEYGGVLDDNKCQVCALSAIFVTKFGLEAAKKNEENRCTFDDYAMRNKLDSIFGRQRLIDIENAFECCTIEDESTSPGVEFSYKHVEDDDQRLIAVMRNVIRNKGNFVPTREGKRRAMRSGYFQEVQS